MNPLKHAAFESLSAEILQALVDEKLDRASQLAPFRLSFGTSLAGKLWLSRRLTMIRKDPSQHPWMYRAIVRKEDSEMVGYISFHHALPDPDLAQYSECGVERGYTIEPNYRRLGYARESILAVIDWARKTYPNAEIFVTIGPENMPSINLAKSLDFVNVGERSDDIGGREYVLKYPAHRTAPA